MRDLWPTGSREALPTKPGWGAEEARRGCLVSGNDFIQSPIVAGKQSPFTNRPCYCAAGAKGNLRLSRVAQLPVWSLPEPLAAWSWDSSRAQHRVWVPMNLGEAA